jgi:hypothetical protein
MKKLARATVKNNNRVVSIHDLPWHQRRSNPTVKHFAQRLPQLLVALIFMALVGKPTLGFARSIACFDSSPNEFISSADLIF